MLENEQEEWRELKPGAIGRMVELLDVFGRDEHNEVPCILLDITRKEHVGVGRFSHLAYEDNWLVNFDWPCWFEGREIAGDPARIAQCDLQTIRMLITALVRNERFCEGALEGAHSAGTLEAIIRRIEALH